MEVTNEVMPTSRERIEEMMEPGPEGPIHMVNLLKFKEQAEYEDGRETDLTGYEAYQLYGQGVAELLKEYGGELMFAADVTFLAPRSGRGPVGRGGHRHLPQPGGPAGHVELGGVAGPGRPSHRRPGRSAQHRDGGPGPLRARPGPGQR